MQFFGGCLTIFLKEEEEEEKKVEGSNLLTCRLE
jgi:hypothetical protein